MFGRASCDQLGGSKRPSPSALLPVPDTNLTPFNPTHSLSRHLHASPTQMHQTLDHPHFALLGISLLVSGLLYTLHRSRRSESRYPPGPPPDPILGNVRQFPRTEWHNTFTIWQKQYGQIVPCISYHRAWRLKHLSGDIVHVDLMGQHMVILNRLEDAEELWSKRGQNYSERLRPRFAMEM